MKTTKFEIKIDPKGNSLQKIASTWQNLAKSEYGFSTIFVHAVLSETSYIVCTPDGLLNKTIITVHGIATSKQIEEIENIWRWKNAVMRVADELNDCLGLNMFNVEFSEVDLEEI